MAGHSAGDSLLREIAAALSKTVRVGDVVGRLGGDEFLVVLKHCDEVRARLVAAKRSGKNRAEVFQDGTGQQRDVTDG